MTAPQPSRNARVMTLRFVPGGPEPITNGFGSFNPSTVVASVAITNSFAKPRLVARRAATFDTKIRDAGLPDPLHRLVDKFIERRDRQLEVLFFGVLDFVVADAVQTLDKHHYGRHSRARNF